MPKEESRGVRKGTKSCTECRRRKVRCIRLAEDAESCRRCEERGLACVAQTQSHGRSQRERLPSRYRIAQLECQVAGLSRAVHGIERELGHRPTQILEPRGNLGASASDDDDDGSSSSEVLVAEQPSHLRSLFQNDWLSLDSQQQAQKLQDRRARASARLLDDARRALQQLIPSKNEISHMVNSTWAFLPLIRHMFPDPYGVASEQELLESYEDMCKPDVDAVRLASWLLVTALTALQTSPERGYSRDELKRRYRRRLYFSRIVSNTVQSTILSHDRLMGTVQALGLAASFLPLQLAQGNIQKVWIQLRHTIAIAELVGLPRAFHAVQLNKTAGADGDETQHHKAQLWQSLCNADRLLAMIINLPPETSRYQCVLQTFAAEDILTPRVYLGHLMEIAARIPYLDNVNAGHPSSPLELTRELRQLSSQTPKSWWTGDTEQINPRHMVQFIHHCVMMRVNLRFAMRQGSDEESLYSRLACMEACELLAKRYQVIRRSLPPGVFVSRLLDLHVFTATVILLLVSHSPTPMDCFNLRIDKPKIDDIVTGVLGVMTERSNNTTGSDFARKGAATLQSLTRLLQQDDATAYAQNLTLTIPLLGRVHIRRNLHPPQVPGADDTQSFQTSAPAHWKLGMQFVPQNGQLPFNTNDQVPATLQDQEGQQLDSYLSWSIEDTYENLFQDALMADNFDQLATGENGYFYNGFSFSC